MEVFADGACTVRGSLIKRKRKSMPDRLRGFGSWIAPQLADQTTRSAREDRLRPAKHLQ